MQGYRGENNDIKVKLKYEDGITIEIDSKTTEQQIEELQKVEEGKERNKRLEQNKSIESKY